MGGPRSVCDRCQACVVPLLLLLPLPWPLVQDVNIGLFEAHIRGGQPMAALGAGGTRQVAALPPSVHAHAATAAVSSSCFAE